MTTNYEKIREVFKIELESNLAWLAQILEEIPKEALYNEFTMQEWLQQEAQDE